MLREAGALEVHMLITSPPYKHCCNLGTDTQKKNELIAARLSVEEICAHIGADSLGYLSLNGLIESIDPLPGIGFCTGCFNRRYPVSAKRS
jgi:amidophosphoribosyltransferase